MRGIGGLVVCLIAALACDARQSAPPPAAATAPDRVLSPMDMVELPPLPTHWIADEPIGTSGGPVSDAMLREPFADRERWLHYGGSYRGWRHSPIEALSPENVDRLELAWAFPTGTTGQFEVSPVVYAGVMYVTSTYNRLFALDARTGELLWRYDHEQPPDLRACCGPVNRGVAIGADSVLMATLDAKLIAFDRRTGEIQWSREIAPYADGFAATSPPMIVGDLVITGIGGGEYGIRGFFDAYDLGTGERVWRHYTVPAEGEPGVESWAGNSYETGGAPTWTTGAYDVETDTVLWTTGNPSPDFNGDLRAGDNLFSNSVIAVDRATGERKWHFQFTPHDVWDLDGNTQLFLVDVERDGAPLPAIAHADRNGYFYLLDRSDGRFLLAEPYVEVNWATIGQDGRPIVNPEAVPGDEPTTRVCPGNMGGMNGAWSGAFNPDLGLAFIPAIESCQTHSKGIVAFVKGIPFLGGLPDGIDVLDGSAHGSVSAIDVATGEVRWRYADDLPMMGGALSTAGGLVFTGTLRGEAIALDAHTGERVWRKQIGGGIRSQPIAFELDGRPHVAIGAGSWATTDAFMAGIDRVPEGGHLFVFALRDP